MRIGIIGAGAIGGLLGVKLARAGHAICVLARGTTLEALRQRPWTLEQTDGRLGASVRASADAADFGAQEIVFVTVKGPALAAAAREAAPMIGPQTTIIPAMNGVPWWFVLAGAGSLPPTPLMSVDPEGAIARAISLEHVIGCVVHASAFVSAPGNVIHQAGNRFICGEPDGNESGRLGNVISVLADAGFEAVTSNNIRRDIWYKLWGNMTANPISAITRATTDLILDDELVRAFILRIMEEAREIGNRIGCEIAGTGESRIEVGRQLGRFKTSMLQDAEAGRPLEIDQLVAAPQEIARALGVPTPNLDTLLGLARLHARTHGLY